METIISEILTFTNFVLWTSFILLAIYLVVKEICHDDNSP